MSVFGLLRRINFNTLYFNFRYLPWKQAFRLPVLVSGKTKLRKLSGNIIFECPIKTGLVQIGFGNIGLFDRDVSRTVWEVYGTVIFRGKAHIGHGSKIVVGAGGVLRFGKNFGISAETSVFVSNRVEFGDDCLLSWEILVMDDDIHKIKNELGEIVNSPQPIVFGDRVWVGCRSTILKGSSVPDGAIIGAGSTVAAKLEHERSVYAGNPAKKIKSDVVWEP